MRTHLLSVFLTKVSSVPSKAPGMQEAPNARVLGNQTPSVAAAPGSLGALLRGQHSWACSFPSHPHGL